MIEYFGDCLPDNEKLSVLQLVNKNRRKTRKINGCLNDAEEEL